MAARRALEPGERALESAGRVSEPARRALEPVGRALEPAERALEPAGRALDPAGRALEPAGRPFEASWEAQGHLGGPAKKHWGRGTKNGAFLVCGGTLGHCPHGATAQKQEKWRWRCPIRRRTSCQEASNSWRFPCPAQLSVAMSVCPSIRRSVLDAFGHAFTFWPARSNICQPCSYCFF